MLQSMFKPTFTSITPSPSLHIESCLQEASAIDAGQKIYTKDAESSFHNVELVGPYNATEPEGDGPMDDMPSLPSIWVLMVCYVCWIIVDALDSYLKNMFMFFKIAKSFVDVFCCCLLFI